MVRWVFLAPYHMFHLNLSFSEIKWPFLVSLQMYKPHFKEYEHICGGAILNKHQILTAAHCFDDCEPYSPRPCIKYPKKSQPLNWIALAG